MYIGVDLHKKYSFITKMDEKGNIIEQFKLSNQPQSILHFVESLPPNCKIALEATANWYFFYELLENKIKEIYLAHPLKTRAIAEAKIKTDKIDSTILAHLLRADLLPTSYIPPREIRDQRELLRYRASLVSIRTAIKNKIHAILSKNGITLPYSDYFGKKALKELKSLNLRHAYRKELDGYLELLEVLNKLIKEVTQIIREIVEENPQARLLTTIPGISYYSALLILSEIGDIRRFPNAKKLCSYAGLVPSVRSSGGRTRYGPITKQGSKWLRWILIELAPHFVRGSEEMKRYFERIARKHGVNTAKVAVARKMLKIIYYMLRDNRPYWRG